MWRGKIFYCVLLPIQVWYNDGTWSSLTFTFKISTSFIVQCLITSKSFSCPWRSLDTVCLRVHSVHFNMVSVCKRTSLAFTCKSFLFLIQALQGQLWDYHEEYFQGSSRDISRTSTRQVFSYFLHNTKLIQTARETCMFLSRYLKRGEKYVKGEL